MKLAGYVVFGPSSFLIDIRLFKDAILGITYQVLIDMLAVRELTDIDDDLPSVFLFSSVLPLVLPTFGGFCLWITFLARGISFCDHFIAFVLVVLSILIIDFFEFITRRFMKCLSACIDRPCWYESVIFFRGFRIVAFCLLFLHFDRWRI